MHINVQLDFALADAFDYKPILKYLACVLGQLASDTFKIAVENLLLSFNLFQIRRALSQFVDHSIL